MDKKLVWAGSYPSSNLDTDAICSCVIAGAFGASHRPFSLAWAIFSLPWSVISPRRSSSSDSALFFSDHLLFSRRWEKYFR